MAAESWRARLVWLTVVGAASAFVGCGVNTGGLEVVGGAAGDDDTGGTAGAGLTGGTSGSGGGGSSGAGAGGNAGSPGGRGGDAGMGGGGAAGMAGRAGMGGAGIAGTTAGAGGSGGVAGGLAGMSGTIAGMAGGMAGAIAGMAGTPVVGWQGPSSVIIAVGAGGRRTYTNDGQTWVDTQEENTNNLALPKTMFDVAWGRDIVVAVGGGCQGNNCSSRIFTWNGTGAWQPATISGGGNIGILRGVAFGAGRWVAVGTAGPILWSNDGKTWMPTNRQGEMPQLRRIAFGTVGEQDMFIAVGDNSARIRSLDGLTWSNPLTGPNTMGGQQVVLNDVAIANGVAIAVGDMGRRTRTVSGVGWSDPVDGGVDLHSVIYDGGQFIAYHRTAAEIGTALTSANGQNWDFASVANGCATTVATGFRGGQRRFAGSSNGTRKVGVTGLGFISVTGAPMSDNPLLRFTFAGPDQNR